MKNNHFWDIRTITCLSFPFAGRTAYFVCIILRTSRGVPKVPILMPLSRSLERRCLYKKAQRFPDWWFVQGECRMDRFSVDTVLFLDTTVHLNSYPRYMLLCMEKWCCIQVLFSLADLTHSTIVSGRAFFDSHFITDFCRASGFHLSFHISTLRQVVWTAIVSIQVSKYDLAFLRHSHRVTDKSSPLICLPQAWLLHRRALCLRLIGNLQRTWLLTI